MLSKAVAHGASVPRVEEREWRECEVSRARFAELDAGE